MSKRLCSYVQLDDSVESVYIFLPSYQTLRGLWKREQNKEVDAVAGVNAGITAGVALIWVLTSQRPLRFNFCFSSVQTSRNALLPSVPGQRAQPKFCDQCWVQRSETSNVRCLKGRLHSVLPIPAGLPRGDSSRGLWRLFLQL